MEEQIILKTVKTQEQLEDFAVKLLGDLYVCERVWSAWSYGTMSQDDFGLAREDDFIIEDIVEAIKKEFTTPKETSDKTPPWQGRG